MRLAQQRTKQHVQDRRTRTAHEMRVLLLFVLGCAAVLGKITDGVLALSSQNTEQ